MSELDRAMALTWELVTRSERTAFLASRVPEATDGGALHLAIVGPYNAGKSTLISALTGDWSISRDAKPETSAATCYAWRDLHLVDLPGWFSGFEEHDEVADEVLRS